MLTNRQEPCLDPLAAGADVLVVQLRPDFLFGLAGQRILPDARHAGLAHAHRPLHQFKLVGRLDGAGKLGEFLAVDQFNAALGQREGAFVLDLVHCDPQFRLSATALAQGGDQFVGPLVDALFGAPARRHVEPRGGGTRLVDLLVAVVEKLGAVVLKVDGVTIGEYQRIAERIVRGPQLHVGAVEHVAGVERIVEQDRVAVVLVDVVHHALLAVRAGALQHSMGDGRLEWLVLAGRVEIGLLAFVRERCGDGV